jgi:hypothetical protein
MSSKLALFATVMVAAIVAAGCGSKSDAGSADADLSKYIGGQPNSAGAQPAATGNGSPKAVADIDPCSLVTKEEIIAQFEASYSPDQLAGFKSAGGSWQITPTPEQQGISKACRFALSGTVTNGDVRHQTEFTVAVTDGAFVNPNANNARNRPIPGVGDEAYFMSRGPMMPYARVGNVAVGIEGFPNTPADKAGVGLLRAAVARVRGG